MIYLASDHVGVSLKNIIGRQLKSLGYDCKDLGPFDEKRVDYTDFANKLVKKVVNSNNKGILICGTGIGMSIMANRHRGIRAAVCTNEYMARFTVMHNNANILCLGARVLGEKLSQNIVKEFLLATFEGGRHALRIKKYDLDCYNNYLL